MNDMVGYFSSNESFQHVTLCPVAVVNKSRCETEPCLLGPGSFYFFSGHTSDQEFLKNCDILNECRVVWYSAGKNLFIKPNFCLLINICICRSNSQIYSMVVFFHRKAQGVQQVGLVSLIVFPQRYLTDVRASSNFLISNLFESEGSFFFFIIEINGVRRSIVAAWRLCDVCFGRAKIAVEQNVRGFRSFLPSYPLTFCSRPIFGMTKARFGAFEGFPRRLGGFYKFNPHVRSGVWNDSYAPTWNIVLQISGLIPLI